MTYQTTVHVSSAIFAQEWLRVQSFLGPPGLVISGERKPSKHYFVPEANATDFEYPGNIEAPQLRRASPQSQQPARGRIGVIAACFWSRLAYRRVTSWTISTSDAACRYPGLCPRLSHTSEYLLPGFFQSQHNTCQGQLVCTIHDSRYTGPRSPSEGRRQVPGLYGVARVTGCKWLLPWVLRSPASNHKLVGANFAVLSP